MKTRWKKTEGMHTNCGFYVDGETVIFKYSGPFDTNTWEWTYVKGTLNRKDFQRGIHALSLERRCHLTGIHEESLELNLHPNGTIKLDFTGGYPNNLSISDLGIRPEEFTNA